MAHSRWWRHFWMEVGANCWSIHWLFGWTLLLTSGADLAWVYHAGKLGDIGYLRNSTIERTWHSLYAALRNWSFLLILLLLISCYGSCIFLIGRFYLCLSEYRECYRMLISVLGVIYSLSAVIAVYWELLAHNNRILSDAFLVAHLLLPLQLFLLRFSSFLLNADFQTIIEDVSDQIGLGNDVLSERGYFGDVLRFRRLNVQEGHKDTDL